jgi:hypothetical protein
MCRDGSRRRKGVNTVTTIPAEELLDEAVELLPARETLAMPSWANVSASNVALAMNAGAWASSATAYANQAVWVAQG